MEKYQSRLTNLDLQPAAAGCFGIELSINVHELRAPGRRQHALWRCCFHPILEERPLALLLQAAPRVPAAAPRGQAMVIR